MSVSKTHQATSYCFIFENTTLTNLHAEPRLKTVRVNIHAGNYRRLLGLHNYYALTTELICIN